MGSYDGKHSLHYICKECRIGSKSMQKSLKCPHCTEPMLEVSVCFRIPKKNDDKQWKIIKKELLHGNRFHSRWWSR